MRILILGKDYASRSFFELFRESEKNIVFSSIKDLNCVECLCEADVVDFAEANEINFILINDEKFMTQTLEDALNNMGVSVFMPKSDVVDIFRSRSNTKKFIYKNKIQTPRFQIFEKPSAALEYARTIKYPQAAKSDIKHENEPPQFFETYTNAKKIVSNFFENGAKRIVFEDYIEGRNVFFWVLTNGISAKIIGTTERFDDEISIFEPNLDENLKETIFKTSIMPTINGFLEKEYIGILGFDFIIDSRNTPWLLGYKTFFDDLDVDFFTKGFDINWLEVFESTILGDVFQKFDIKPKNTHMLTLRDDDEIKFFCANTKSNLRLYLRELGYDKEILPEIDFDL